MGKHEPKIYVPAKDQRTLAEVEIVATKQDKTVSTVIGDAMRLWLREQGTDAGTAEVR